jgi:hypothetical protein
MEGGNHDAIHGIRDHSPEKPACYRKRVHVDRSGGGFLIEPISGFGYRLYLISDIGRI